VKAAIYVHYLCRATGIYLHQLSLAVHAEGQAASLHGALLVSYAVQIDRNASPQRPTVA